jgi:pyruvate dehydrogenase E2 component (dihydrolipoamide acetyltransferase)
MPTEVRMPKLGMAMKKGKVKSWLVAEGGTVEKGSPLLEIMTDKINAVVEAPASGVLGRVLAAANSELPVGALLGLIGEPGEALNVPEGAAPTAAATAPSTTAGVASPAAAGQAPPPGGEVLASPAARRRARELGVDLALVPPAAPGKRITTDDVEAFAGASPPPAAAEPAAAKEPSAVEAAAGEAVPFEGIRRVVAEHLHESLQTMAQVTVSREAEVSGLVSRRSQLAPGFEAASGLRLTYTDLLVETVARLLPEHRMLNATLDGDCIRIFDAVHMGIAVALEDGLIVPVIRDAHTRSLVDIARDRTELAAKAQSGALGLDEIEGGTFTISNLGSFGADSFTPIVNPPQCAILGVGRIVEKAMVVEGEVRVRPTMWLSLTFDHRLVDGAPAARFLQALADRLGGSHPAKSSDFAGTSG